MSEVVIFNFKDPRIQLGDYQSQVDAIFFEATTKKEFKSIQEKEDFHWKYLGYYLSHYPEYAWLALDGEVVLGYVCGMPWTVDPTLFKIQPHLRAFELEFVNYPAHLHINLSPQARGKGVGKQLVRRIKRQFLDSNIKGLHIMTGPGSSNRVFYQKIGFDYEVELNGICFMGCTTRL